ncbi:MAG: deoxyribose-phosphate aldolase [Symbiobacteriaceae bacterium]|nr:deoxyribose-phosphate aldolase [Symbiobacteriaceae bacterium]
MSSSTSIASVIDHTLLKPEATTDAVRQICAEALEFNFASVCVNSCHATLVSDLLRGSEVKTCCVIGFPLGAASTLSKVFEAVTAIANGANELDMVINIGAVKEGDWRTVEDDITAVANVAKGKAQLKVILETCLLDDQEKELACLVARKAGADYVKTSTGFSSGGATVADVRLMKRTVPQMKIKASGGIRDLHTARAMLEAGADRLGCSAGVAIVKEEQQ